MAITALHSPATGLRALATRIAVVANNLANKEATAFKRSRVNFEDLMYLMQKHGQHQRRRRDFSCRHLRRAWQRGSGQGTGDADQDTAAFELNSQSIQTADQALQAIGNLRCG